MTLTPTEVSVDILFDAVQKLQHQVTDLMRQLAEVSRVHRGGGGVGQDFTDATYVKKSGDTMTGTLNMGLNDLIICEDVALERFGTTKAHFCSPTTGLSRDVQLSTLAFGSAEPTGANGVIQPNATGNKVVRFRAYDVLDTIQSCAVLANYYLPTGMWGEFNIPRAGDITMLYGKSIDCSTNNAYLKPQRISISIPPTPQTNELLVWRDSDDDKTYLVINDPDVGVRKVELT